MFNNKNLSVAQLTLFLYLIDLAINGRVINYAALEPITGIYRRNYGPHLALIARICKANSLPFINCLVQKKSALDKGLFEVGDGYYIPCPFSDLESEVSMTFDNIERWKEFRRVLEQHARLLGYSIQL
ncbi:hypothetical protein [Photobacterium lutimaris]|uniref:Uncharacterized protein n=1 Tax=Photobacterium lutimaris TaxID=388278 RepID=A0A2T3J1N1_9GAMM|nr:hypothetical protein [Photobacterium lutimaris]PSU34986.1 hypothetical protein C9I99_07920 [Photobacterium lutimaris]TDR77341.1 hypothetical protein DFP78_102358 [Photobacterium lutimaris]